MLRSIYKIVFVVLLFTISLLATADGPDYFMVRGVLSNDTLSVRETYDYKSRKVGNLSFDADCLQNIDYFKKNGQSGWVHIKYNNIDGWLNGRYVTESDNSDCYKNISSNTVNNFLLKEGDYSWSTSNTEATLNIKKEENNAFIVKGNALSGTSNKYGPKLGDIIFTAFMNNNVLSYSNGDYVFTLTVSDDGSFDVQEEGFSFEIGEVSFAGHYISDNLPSFPCNKENTLIEKTICNNIELSRLDKDMVARYSTLKELKNNPINPNSFNDIVLKYQKSWLKSLNNCEPNNYEECLSVKYNDRINHLDKQLVDFQIFYTRQKEYKDLIDRYKVLSLQYKDASKNINAIGCSMEVSHLKSSQTKEYSDFFNQYKNKDKTMPLYGYPIKLRGSCSNSEKILAPKNEQYVQDDLKINKHKVLHSDLLHIMAKDIMSEYENNEIAADNKYKGKKIQVTGIISDIAKDIMGNLYVTLGTGELFEVVKVQAFFNDNMNSKLATLRKGSRLTVRCTVDGLMLNVLMKECSITSE